MNLPLNKPSHRGGGNAGAVVLGGTVAAPAQLCVGAVGFGPQWEEQPTLRELYETACQSIVRQESELSEANARIAVLEQEQAILKATIESLRDALCADKCADKAAADGGWGNI